MWLTVIIVAVVIGALIGFLGSNDGERGSGALGGALVGGMGCGYLLIKLFLWGLGIVFLLWLFGAMFG